MTAVKQAKTSAQKDVPICTGRRKQATARVRLFVEGTGKIMVNGRDYEKYFPTVDLRNAVMRALQVTNNVGKVDIKAKVQGGGLSGQAGAISLGIARSLLRIDPNHRSPLRKEGLLTRDPREKERKKYGRKGARKRFQWTKR